MTHWASEEEREIREKRKRQHFAIRFNLLFSLIFILFGILILRLSDLQFLQGRTLRAQENTNSIVSVPLAPIRGNIYDADGVPIAYTKAYQSLYYRADPVSIQDQAATIALAQKLADILARYGNPGDKPLTAAQILQRMDVGYDMKKQPTQAPSYYSVPRLIQENLNEKEIAYISSHRDQLPNVDISVQGVRQYNPQHIAVQLVGYLRPFNIVQNYHADYLNYYEQPDIRNSYLADEDVGFDGLEFEYQKELRGQTGEAYYPVNALQQIIGPVQYKAPVKGDNLYLTINAKVQLAAQNAIMQHLKDMKSPTYGGVYHSWIHQGYQATDGYAVAMEVKTGRVVAMASMPDYDPNVWLGGISQAQLNQLQFKYINGAIRSRYANRPDFGTHPTSLVYMGSTQKPLSVLLGLNLHLFTPSETYQDRGVFYFGKNNSSKLTNYDSEAFGRINAQQALHYSSNVFMSAMVGERLYEKYPKTRIQIWDRYMKEFGLGVLTGSGLPNESTGVQDYLNPRAGSEQARLIFASFGQQAKYTTLQLAQYAATLASGKRMKPLFVDHITDAQGNVVQRSKPEVLNTVTFPQTYWNVVRGGMTSHVYGFDGFPYDFARKTGTSEENVAGKNVNNAVFIAYAPRNNPTLAVAVVVPEGGLGAYGAAPIARKIFDAYDHYIGLTGTPNPNAPAN